MKPEPPVPSWRVESVTHFLCLPANSFLRRAAASLFPPQDGQKLQPPWLLVAGNISELPEVGSFPHFILAQDFREVGGDQLPAAVAHFHNGPAPTVQRLAALSSR